ncbi:hypothetical protein SJ05684_c23640 [Sinorhizobium sojae CCBAU 05684]|uniref:Transmembrane protein n=1 Tax=Sinorhizobium sojae CCBAU 05684 TaxID=716928 RepID=A0A249PDQ3_9HYPH|nr:hypothetical protein [Sinorhizobium sojae]ASY63804.1 hypothetical protein SJ05684_c23640 [Sinorhizobium sojae CCBAU 05684]
MHRILGHAMFLDDEISDRHPRPNEARWGIYLAIAALAACVLMILGLLVPATAQAAESTLPPAAHMRPNDIAGPAQWASDVATDVSLPATDPTTAASTAHRIAEVDRQMGLTPAATAADRQILAGLILIATALLAGTAFAFWRNQMAAFVKAEARHAKVRRHGR